MTPAGRAAILAAALALAACAPTTRVILLPLGNGRPAAVDVSTPQGSTALDTPYATADVGSGGRLTTGVTDAQSVQKRYGDVLEKLPAPQHFTLYFTTGTSDLTPESHAQLQGILEQATARPGGEIFVTGHADRVGGSAANDALSLKRAEAIRDMLIGLGFDPVRIIASGRGDREPLEPTRDQVSEPKNRRVEIEVR
ncbi:MAG: OmpA family protein [Burkholderiaceae bacterium]|jgi:outer membrane protein OmpA-like peptidoglycan-associated protein|nr:OmpA family protein [Burkholderiaceae bacterium]